MLSYIGKRLLALLPTVAVPMLLLFFMLRISSGDPAAVLAGEDATAEEVNAIREELGLNDPLLVQFFSWLGRMITLNFGDSLFLGQPVSTLVIDAFIVTSQLAICALVIAIIIGPLLGAFAASTKFRALDSGLVVGSALGVAMPTFWLAIIGIFIFGVTLNVLPVSGYVAPSEDFGQFFFYMALPAITLGVLEAATFFRYSRNAVLDAKHQPFVQTARAQGLGEGTIVSKYVFRAAMAPVVTVVGLSAASLLGGAVVTEEIFSIPGLGDTLLTAVGRRDYPLIEGSIFLIAIVFVLINLLVDIICAIIDPRIRYQKAKG
ncbi:ABC transporter permease [Flaviflexus massiliensis]|nr:ABC transporter permease [Flaviflexus massiliensis]